MEWVEASGKSLSEAREAVLDLLGVAEDDAEFVILTEPKAGLFGRVRGEARVQARVRPVTPPPKRARRQRPERKRSGAETKSGSGNTSDSNRSEIDADSSAAKPSPTSGRGSNGKSGSSGASPSRTAEQPRVRKRTGASPEKSEVVVEESLTLEQQGEAGRTFLSGLIREFGLQAEVSIKEIDDETIEVAATGDDLGLLVGPRGATLAAVQDLTRTFVQRQSENRTDRILVDVAGYREKRSAALRRFAEGIVAEVNESGEERALEPMTAADRKVVHDAVNEIDGVQTRSEGEDPSRYIVIQPS